MSVEPISSPASDVHSRALPQPGSRATLPCLYCRADIATGDFVFWTPARRLLSATCPQCRRRVTLLTTTWRRWSSEAPSQGSAAEEEQGAAG